MTRIRHLLGTAALTVVCSPGHAVMLAPDHLGQVLLYPYYTVEGGTNTLLSVENTTPRGKAAKVRFLEALNGRRVLQFNLYLAPYDVWTAMITADAGGGAKLVVNDSSCTAPAIATAIGGTSEQPLSTFGFDGGDGVPADAEARRGAARTREGYIEVIEMGDIDPEYELASGANFLAAAAHVDGSPSDCAAINAEWTGTDPFPTHGQGAVQATADIRGLYATTGGLAGTGTLINVAQGTDYSYDPVALVGFYMDKPSMHTAPDSASPSLADAAPTSTVTVIDPATGIPADKTDDWTNPAAGAMAGIDAVSAVLMRWSITNEFVVNPEIHAGTDWVVTFPTKRWYVDQVVNPVRPFSSLFASGGACEQGSQGIFDQRGDLKVSGFPEPPPEFDTLCWTANVITFEKSQVLASPQIFDHRDIQTRLDVDAWQLPAGRMVFWFVPNYPGGVSHRWSDAHTTGTGQHLRSNQLLNEAAPNHTFEGLPVIGFAVQRYVNDLLPGGVLSNYGGLYGHRYQRKVSP